MLDTMEVWNRTGGLIKWNTPEKEMVLKLNSVYRELNDLYHDIALQLGISDSAFTIFMQFSELGMAVCSGISVSSLIQISRPSIQPFRGWKRMDIFIWNRGRAVTSISIWRTVGWNLWGRKSALWLRRRMRRFWCSVSRIKNSFVLFFQNMSPIFIKKWKNCHDVQYNAI